METSYLEATGLKKTYGKRTVVKDVALKVGQGEVVGLLGPNGAGKTTSFYMMVGLIKADAGKITLDGDDITDFPIHLRALQGVGYLPQEASVFRDISVEGNIYAVLENRDLSRTRRHEILESLIKEFGLDHIRKSKGADLSGDRKSVV